MRKSYSGLSRTKSPDYGVSEGRIPLDFASILSVSHIPLLQESPLSELAEALKQHARAEVKGDLSFTKLVKRGLNIATTHLSSDYRQLHDFNESWESGRYFATNTAMKNLLSRTSVMREESEKYLQISSTLKRARFPGSEEGLAGEHVTAVLAKSTRDLSSRLLKQLTFYDRMKSSDA